MTSGQVGQVTRDTAEVYDDHLVPALFGQWALRVADMAQVRSGERVLDVACGTGVLARAMAELIGPIGTVVGIDVDEGMLAVARRKAPEIEWQWGRAESLPFETGHFDAVVSQFGLMYVQDQRTALREMMRVLRPGGQLALAVWDSIERVPGYAALVALLQRLFGDRVACAMRVPFALGDRALIRLLFAEAGDTSVRITTRAGIAHFPSIASWISTEIRGFALAGVLDDAQFALLAQEAQTTLRQYLPADGSVGLETSAHIVTATRE